MLQAQTAILQRDLIWLNPRVQLKLSEKDQLQVGMEWRTYVFPQRTHHLIGPRLLYTHKLSEKWTIGLGGLHFLAYRPGNPFSETQSITTEWRSNVEVQRFDQALRGLWAQRLNLEQRFFLFNSGTEFALRARYRLEYLHPLSFKEKKYTIKGSIEPMWQYSEIWPYGLFDQVRLRLTCTIPMEPLSIEIGYMYWFQQSAEAATYLSHHIIPISLTLKL
jgi:hypothetical protein